MFVTVDDSGRQQSPGNRAAPITFTHRYSLEGPRLLHMHLHMHRNPLHYSIRDRRAYFVTVLDGAL